MSSLVTVAQSDYNAHVLKAKYDPGGRPVRVTMPGYFGEAVIEVLYEYFDDNQVKSIVARNVAGDAPVEI